MELGLNRAVGSVAGGCEGCPEPSLSGERPRIGIPCNWPDRAKGKSRISITGLRKTDHCSLIGLPKPTGRLPVFCCLKNIEIADSLMCTKPHSVYKGVGAVKNLFKHTPTLASRERRQGRADGFCRAVHRQTLDAADGSPHSRRTKRSFVLNQDSFAGVRIHAFCLGG